MVSGQNESGGGQWFLAKVSPSGTKDEPEMKEGMTEDEVMALNFLQGAQVALYSCKPSHHPVYQDAGPNG